MSGGIEGSKTAMCDKQELGLLSNVVQVGHAADLLGGTRMPVAGGGNGSYAGLGE